MLPIPIGTSRPQMRFPWANVCLIAANVAIFMVGQIMARNSPIAQVRASGIPLEWNRFVLDPKDLQLLWGFLPYQFITYQFLHEGLMHVGFNMLFLYVFGNNLNEKLGNTAYLAFYLAGGVLAGCGQLISSNSATVGASGSISAVTGLYLVLLPQTNIKLFVWYFIYMGVWEISSVYFILFEIGENIVEQMLGQDNVAYMAHIAGAVAGILIGFFLLFTRLVQRDHYDLLAMFSRFRRRQAYRAVVAKGYDPFNAARGGTVAINPFRREPVAAPAADSRITSLRREITRLLQLHESADAAKRFLELKGADPTAALPPQEQLDVANQLMSDGQYSEAAAAYEDYLRLYPTTGAGQQDQVTLILGLIYARYLPQADRARELFRNLLPRLHNAREREMAEAELQRLEGAGGAVSPG